jgi:hypothetical protein
MHDAVADRANPLKQVALAEFVEHGPYRGVRRHRRGAQRSFAVGCAGAADLQPGRMAQLRNASPEQQRQPGSLAEHGKLEAG